MTISTGDASITAAEAAAAKPVARALPYRLASFAVLLAVWEIAAHCAHLRALPSVETVAVVLGEEIRDGALPFHLAVTLARVLVAFLVAMAGGVAIGLAMGRWWRVDLLLDGWIIVLLNLPALVIAVLFYVWFGLTDAAAVGAVALNKLPLVAMTMREGARALERDYAEMAEVFHVPRWRRFRHVVAPQLVPFVLVATRSGLALVWKIVLVVELLGRSDGIGFQLQLYFQLFDVPRILAYALAFVAVVQLIEWGLLQPLERRVLRWRR
ncbi:MAG: transporter permease [Rhodospirillales bacterium]|nr:transporter permease [Rhodospirillales bacterium]